jgi:hypothetical protein
MIKILTIVTAIFISGCASINVTPPKKVDFDKERTFNLEYHTAWVRTVDWFADHDVIIDKIEKESGLITAKHLLETDNKYIDCGKIDISGSYNDSIEMVGSLNVTVRRVDENRTKVNVNFFGRYKYSGRDAWDGRHVTNEGRCVSTGLVESSIHSYIAK